MIARGLAGLAVCLLAQAVSATEVEQRGRHIYHHGESLRGTEIRAVLPGGGGSPGRLLPCVGCHGADRRGRPEGVVRPADITAEALFDFGRRRDDGSRRAPYDKASLRRAVRQGLDPDGRPLDPVMPRYHLADRDLDDLLAFLMQAGEPTEPGVTASELTLALVLPADPAGAVVRRLAEAMVAHQRIYGRHVRLKFTAPDDFGRMADVLAAVGAVEGEVAADVPVIGAARKPGPNVFRLVPGPIERAAALGQEGWGRRWGTNPSSAADLDPPTIAWIMDMAEPFNAASAPVLAETYAALSVVLEALRRAGREVGRARLMAELEGIRDFRTGVLPPISFSPVRRVGTGGFYVVELNEERGGTVDVPPRWVPIP